MEQGLGRSPTFVVGSGEQQSTLDALQRREQHFSEQYQKNKPLCFNAKAYQKTHPRKAAQGYKDADATLVSPMLVGVADGVSQIEEFGIDASELPNELLNAVEELAVQQLLPGAAVSPQDSYRGPISMMRSAYESTESLGSTTVLLAIMDNSTRIHGKLHPMIAVLSIGDCEILILRRQGPTSSLEAVFETEMQRIGGHAQSPLQVARVDDTVDPDFTEDIAIEVIERGSAVHCVSAFEGDIVVMGSDGVFDNLFAHEIAGWCDEMIPNSTPRTGAKFAPTDRNLLGKVAKRIVEEAHAKTQAVGGVYADAPIGKGGKVDDTCCVVGEVVEWTEAHGVAWNNLRKEKRWTNLLTCGGNFRSCRQDSSDDELVIDKPGKRNYPSNPNGSFSTYYGSFSEYGNNGGAQSSFGSGYGSFFGTGGSFFSQGRTGRTGSNYDANKSFASTRGGYKDSDSDEESDKGSGCSVM